METNKIDIEDYLVEREGWIETDRVVGKGRSRIEKDIKIVEEVACSIWDDTGCDVYLGKRERDALKNLIKGYQDLVKTN